MPAKTHQDEKAYQQPALEYPVITREQHAFLSMLTSQRCANLVEAIDFYTDLPEPVKRMLETANPETIEFLRELRKEEVQGLKSYLLLRSTGSYLAWGVGALVGAIIAGSALYNTITEWIGRLR